MTRAPALVILAGAALAVAFPAYGVENAGKSPDNPDGCKVVHLKPGENPPSGTVSTSVSAGGGRVSGTTTGSSSVTVHAGGGSASSVVTGAGSSSGGTTTVTSANGDCTIYINPGEKR